MDDAAVAAILEASNEAGFADMGEYAGASDFFFQVVFVATAMSIVSGAVAERMKLWAFLAFAIVMTGLIYPMEGSWTWNGDSVFGIYALDYADYAGSGIVHLAGAAAALAGVFCLAHVKANMAQTVLCIRSLVQTCHWLHWVPSSSGWDGSVSTADLL